MSSRCQGLRLFKFFLLSSFLFLGDLRANVLGVSYQNFFPSPAQTDYITVHSTESIREGKWRMHLFGSYSGNNLLAYEVPIQNQKQQTIEDQLTAMQLGVAYGITSQLEYALALPLQLGYTIKPIPGRSHLVQNGVTMIHHQFKYVHKRRGDSEVDPTGMAVVASLNLPNTREDGFLGDRQNPIVTIEGVFDHGTERESYSFNLGYRWRSPGEAYLGSPVFPLQDQLILSGAYQKQFQTKPIFSWIAEVYGAFPVDKGAYERAKDISSAEAIFGIRKNSAKSYRWTAGMGAEILKGTMSPDWRLFAGVSWDFSWVKLKKEEDALLNRESLSGNSDDIVDPMSLKDEPQEIIEDGDRDGVVDDSDMCPRTPRRVKVDQEGCPLDSDGDSIPDYEDQCPRTPPGEVVNGKGCRALK